MWLSQLDLSNYRACADTSLHLDPNLTVLVGENASGKSALVDGIRLATYPASGRSTLWFDRERDVHRAAPEGTAVSAKLTFSGLSEVEQAIYMAHLVDGDDKLVFGTAWATATDVPRRNIQSISIGSASVDDPEPSARRRIAHVYLPPLRDAVKDLDGGDGVQLFEVLKVLLDKDQDGEEKFVDFANNALSTIADQALPKMASANIQAQMGDATPPSRAHTVGIASREQELRRLSRLLRVQLAEDGLQLGEVGQIGLGYANLLYISMIVLQLSRASEYDLTLLLVEEPEAHLHPQLQTVLLDYLMNRARESGTSDAKLRPAGKIQVIVTTHSPVLASAVSISNVGVVTRHATDATTSPLQDQQEVQGDEQHPEDHTEEQATSGEESIRATGLWTTRVTSIGRLGLTKPEIRKIDRYLHTTRAALLFARHVILVEGIAESVLMPVFAGIIYSQTPPVESETPAEREAREERNEHNRTSLRQFKSASIVAVDGVDFLPYLKLLLGGNTHRLDRLAVITDADGEAGQLRRATYRNAFSKSVHLKRLEAFVGTRTLEADLFAQKDNETILRTAFLELHKLSATSWDALAEAAKDMSPAERADLFGDAIRTTRKAEDKLSLNIGKGDFAQVVAEGALLASEAGTVPLTVPPYIVDAIRFVAEK
ncbi:ATP-dependent nuclease [Microterricola viridarii]|uniref:Putative ATP-dependent endonuclease of the OLD family n=1 Tax=Microterricola viridarii TaxID=412690 RepID=A0A1H1V9H5_9MICO|nr:AAA family ATPase [Microterricola viridarii]SDS81280.1 putative ATP-dependent endonuclease of the OLD family [Microterricola viridarii]